ncbi:hypothetical protein ACFY9A_23495 [Streptomyces rubradiris]
MPADATGRTTRAPSTPARPAGKVVRFVTDQPRSPLDEPGCLSGVD